MRKSTKILSLCCLCLFSFFIFAGCGTIGYTFTTNNNGSITETFTISLDSTTLSANGIDTLATMSKVDEIVNHWWTTTSTTADTGDTVKFEYNTATPTKRTIKLEFQSSKAYQKFYNITPSTNDDIQKNIIPSTFCDKLVMCYRPINVNNFAPLSIYNELVDYIANTYYSGDMGLTLSKLDKITVNIAYVYPANYMVHSNADYVERNGIYSAHLWTTNLSQITTTNADNPKIMYIYRNYYSAQNITNWYLLALGLTILFAVIIFLIFFIKSRKKSTNSTQDTTISTSDTTTNLDNTICVTQDTQNSTQIKDD